MRYLSQRLREVQGREQTWLERGVKVPVYASLARNILGLPAQRDGPLLITGTHETLAARCDVSRPRLSRELKRLEDEGRLVLERGKIKVRDRNWFERRGR